MDSTEEPLMRGELVTLREHATADDPLGRVLSVSLDGQRAEVAWHNYGGGHEHEVTVEPTLNLRRVHESEMEPEE
jgi:hypothetical protein